LGLSEVVVGILLAVPSFDLLSLPAFRYEGSDMHDLVPHGLGVRPVGEVELLVVWVGPLRSLVGGAGLEVVAGVRSCGPVL
jgi:hypothetical protein